MSGIESYKIIKVNRRQNVLLMTALADAIRVSIAKQENALRLDELEFHRTEERALRELFAVVVAA